MSTTNGSSTDAQVWELVAEWDNLDQPLAPLNEQQQKSVLELTDLCANRFLLSTPINVNFWLSPVFLSFRYEIGLLPLQDEIGMETAGPNDTGQGETEKHAEGSILESFASLKEGQSITSSQQVIIALNVCLAFQLPSISRSSFSGTQSWSGRCCRKKILNSRRTCGN